jgi:DNA-binding response OmpR family regulator
MKLAVKWEVGKNSSNGRGSQNGTRSPLDLNPIIRHETPRGIYNVLVVDDDPNLMRLMATILRTSGMEVLTATDGHAALEVAMSHDVDAIVLDLRMPNLDGRAFYRELRACGIEAPVLIASAFGAREAQQELGAQASIEKPFDPEVLITELQQILEPEPDATE